MFLWETRGFRAHGVLADPDHAVSFNAMGVEQVEVVLSEAA